MQRDRKAVAAAWPSAAERDLRGARAMIALEPALAAFHARQAAEKAPNAMLVRAVDPGNLIGNEDATRAVERYEGVLTRARRTLAQGA